MDCCLIVYHPYRSLDSYRREFDIDQQLFETTWRIINDSLKTDAALLYPPYEITMACLVLAAKYRNKQLAIKPYMIDTQIDLERVHEIVKLILKYYDLLPSYEQSLQIDEGKQMRELLARIPKPKVNSTASSRPSSQPNEQQLQLAMHQQGVNGK